MHAHRAIEAFAAVVFALALGACSGASAPPPPAPAPAAAAQPADPNRNPLAGTVLEAQGDAMRKARGVQDTLQQSEAQRRAQMDEQAQ